MPQNTQKLMMTIGFFVLCLQCLASVQIPDTNRPCRVCQTTINGLTFRIDPRMELLYAVGYIGGYPFMNGLDIQYKQDVEQAFSPYKDHEVLAFWRQIGPKGFVLDGPVFTVLRQMDSTIDPPKNTPKDENDAAKFIRLLSRFAADADFPTFYNTHRDFYDLVLDTMAFNMKDCHEVQRIERYFGTQQNSYTVIINLLGAGNFGPRVRTPSGLDLYCVMEPQAKCGNLPGFDDPLQFDTLLWHEFSHSFVNPLVDEYAETLNKLDRLYEPIAASMRAQGYPNWDITIKEHIVNAVSLRLTTAKYGRDLASKAVFRSLMGRRYIYTKALCDKLEEYEASRDRYPCFRDFFPVLIDVFSDITLQDITALQAQVDTCRQPHIATMPYPVSGYDPEATLIIEPTAEPNAAQQQKLHAFIERYQAQLNPHFRIVTDTRALQMDLSDYDLIVLGTPTGNRFLRQYLDRLPLTITPTGITANRLYEGRGYQLITSWVNPLNDSRKMTVLTAQDTADIIDINQIPYGSTHFVIAKNKVPIKRGNYRRFMEVWICE